MKDFQGVNYLCAVPFSPDLSMKISYLSETVLTIFIKFSCHSTPKGAPACAKTSKSYDWDLRNIAKINSTSRERHKSAPYLRLKNSKRAKGHESVKKTQSIKKTQSQANKKSIKLTKNPNDGAGDPFAFLTSIVAKHQKIEGGPFGENFFEKKSHSAEKN